MAQNLQIMYAVISKKGERRENEDCVGISEEAYGDAFFLCDGLGGHGDGAEASALVVEVMKYCARQGMSLEESAEQAQTALLRQQVLERKEASMKSTLCTLLVSGRQARFLHVGDSRIYWFDRGHYKLRSKDHSVPQILADAGKIKEKQIRCHADRSRLLRVMGTPWDSPKYQVKEKIPVRPGTSFLLCSDGFWEWIEERQMEKTLRHSSHPEEWLQRMEEIVLAKGSGSGMDNYSAVAVFIRNARE